MSSVPKSKKRNKSTKVRIEYCEWGWFLNDTPRLIVEQQRELFDLGYVLKIAKPKLTRSGCTIPPTKCVDITTTINEGQKLRFRLSSERLHATAPDGSVDFKNIAKKNKPRDDLVGTYLHSEN